MSHALRIRRALSLSTALLSPTRRTTVTTALYAAATAINAPHKTPAAVGHRFFHSTQHLSLSSAHRSFNDIDKIDPDTVLFEGCDYRHFLIVMNFGKDPREHPPHAQMIETYVQTCAKVVGSFNYRRELLKGMYGFTVVLLYVTSVEEAKKRIYACSTTTYTGFQVEVDEETSKKFEGLPGVTFVLPDSYIDPLNKEYGGDKYDNGVITPRPPPVQYGRQRGFTRDDQRPRDPMPNQQGNSSYNQQGNRAYNQHGSVPQGGRGYPPQAPQQGFPQRQSYPSQQNYPRQQNYGPSGQADRGTPMPGGAQYPRVGTDGFQGGQRNFVPSQEGNYNRGYNHPQGQMSNQQGNHGGNAPPGQYRNDSGNYAHNQPEGQGGNHPEGHGGYAAPGQMGNFGDNRSSFSSPVPGAYGQTGAGNFEQNGAGQYRQGPSGNNYGHGAGHAPRVENQRFPPSSNELSSPLDHGINSPGAQTGFNQGRY
ncbi:hypothetical protein KSS87_021043 [Heliosperma pusillum]|nr:hypothetical protein KSS87_021043 [Heliosperma pusillum]